MYQLPMLIHTDNRQYYYICLFLSGQQPCRIGKTQTGLEKV